MRATRLASSPTWSRCNAGGRRTAETPVQLRPASPTQQRSSLSLLAVTQTQMHRRRLVLDARPRSAVVLTTTSPHWRRYCPLQHTGSNISISIGVVALAPKLPPPSPIILWLSEKNCQIILLSDNFRPKLHNLRLYTTDLERFKNKIEIFSTHNPSRRKLAVSVVKPQLLDTPTF